MAKRSRSPTPPMERAPRMWELAWVDEDVEYICGAKWRLPTGNKWRNLYALSISPVWLHETPSTSTALVKPRVRTSTHGCATIGWRGVHGTQSSSSTVRLLDVSKTSCSARFLSPRLWSRGKWWWMMIGPSGLPSVALLPPAIRSELWLRRLSTRAVWWWRIWSTCWLTTCPKQVSIQDSSNLRTPTGSAPTSECGS